MRPLLILAVFASALTLQRPERLLVSLAAEHRIALYDAATGKERASFAAVNGPHEIAVSADGRFAYAANSGSGPGGQPGQAVTAIDLRSRRVTQLATTPHLQPHDVRVSRNGRLLWVAAAPSRAILEMDAATGGILRTLSSERDGGWFVVATPDDTKLYVPLLEGKGLTSIQRGTSSSRVVLSGGAFSGADVSPDGRELWALEHENRQLRIVSTASDTMVATIPLESDAFGRVQFTPDGARLLLVQEQRALLFDVAKRAIGGAIGLPFSGKVISVSADGKRAAVSHPSDDKVSVLDLVGLKVTKTFVAGRTPDGLAWVR